MILKRWRLLAPIALMAGLLAGGEATPALAASPKITIGASSYLPPAVTFWYVAYGSGQDAQATIQGNITGAANGDVVRLYAQRFPYRKAAVVAGTTTLSSVSGATPYTFTVTPKLATRYRVKLSRNGSVVATSRVQMVYVVAGGQATGVKPCQSPVCKETIKMRVFVPASALRTEMRKRTYPYFGIRLGSGGTPPAPTWLYLNAGHARVSKATRVSATQYKLQLHYTFTIGSHSYNWLWETCTKDTLTKDGMGLPNHHGCGAPKVSPLWSYLG